MHQASIIPHINPSSFVKKQTDSAHVYHFFIYNCPLFPSQFFIYKKQKATGDECSLLLNEADGVVRGMMDDDLFVNSLHS